MSYLLKEEKKSRSNIKIILLFILTIVVVSVSIILSVFLTVCCLLNQNEILHRLDESEHKYAHGAVASDQEICSEIGVQVLKENGTAVDAAVATVMCLGVVNMHSSGIGGGGAMIVHNPNQNQHLSTRSGIPGIVYDYREVVPQKLTDILNETDPKSLALGGLSIAVPGEIAGLHMAWREHGKLPWKRLFEPAINLSKNGFPLHKRVREAAIFMKSFIFSDPGFRELLFDNDTVKDLGTIIKNPQLAATLETISNNPLSFYDGDLARQIIEDVKNFSGIIEIDDLKQYQVKKRNTLDMKLNNGMLLKTAPPPYGGIIVEFILNVLQGYNFSLSDFSTTESIALTYHRIVEAMKFGFAKRTLFGDPDFMDQKNLNELINNLTDPNYGNAIRNKIRETAQPIDYYDPVYDNKIDHGTTHVSIYAPDGSAVSVTNSINIWFGSGCRSTRTGIIYNNHIDDFSIPNHTNAYLLRPSPFNNMAAGKRPFSSMSPMIITENDKLKMILGGSGGTRIISSIASVSLYKIFFNYTLGEAVVHPRVHHQLTPDKVIIEEKYPVAKDVVKILKEKFRQKIAYTMIPEYSSVQAICLENGDVYAKSDPRKYGQEAGF